jgi:hypothetical protein
MDLKVRDRTEEELEVRKKEFIKICDILDNLKINFFLNSGILLGAIRDNNFIKWDWDIEISVFSHDFFPKIDLISNILTKSGFKIIKIIRDKNNLKIDFTGIYPSNVTSYTIYGWQYSKIRDVYWRKELSIPSRFLNKLSKFNFLGREFNCPNNIEEYLTFVYGNWKVPLRTSNKKIYLTKNYKKNTLLYTILIEKFLMRIYHIFKN